MKALQINNVYHAIEGKKILNNVNLTVDAGEFVSIIGPSGCGKSTLLRAILGTHPPIGGEIYADGVRMLSPNRHVGIVYQNYSLYDFMNATNNVAFGLAQDQTTMPYRLFCYFFGWKKLKKLHRLQAEEMLRKVELGESLSKFPKQLSGGMKQRVAIAQALIMRPKVILLDEPFGALDEAVREKLQDLLISLYNENKAAVAQGLSPPYTMIIVTHELNEAIYLSDRVIGLSQYHADGNNGATIVYNEKATAFDKKSERDYSLFVKQKEDIRKIVFNQCK